MRWKFPTDKSNAGQVNILIVKEFIFPIDVRQNTQGAKGNHDVMKSGCASLMQTGTSKNNL